MVSRYTHQVLDFFNNHEDKKRAEIWTKDKFNNKRNKPLSNRWKENCPSSPGLNNQPTRYKIHQIQRSGELYQLYPIKKHPLKIINWSPKRESKLMIYY